MKPLGLLLLPVVAVLAFVASVVGVLVLVALMAICWAGHCVHVVGASIEHPSRWAIDRMASAADRGLGWMRRPR